MTDAPDNSSPVGDNKLSRKIWLTPEQVKAARIKLGEIWGKGRPLYAAELARSLRLAGRDPGLNVVHWERGKANVTGPVSALITLYVNGTLPPDGIPEGGPIEGPEHHWSKARKG